MNEIEMFFVLIDWGMMIVALGCLLLGFWLLVRDIRGEG